MTLSQTLFTDIQKELSVAKLVTEDEFKKRVKITPVWEQIVAEKLRNDFSSLTVTHYSISNTKLIGLLNKISGQDITNVTSLHVAEYYKGNFLRGHRDTGSGFTLTILLESNCKGGDFYIEGKRAELNQPGDYVMYNGGKQKHEVRPILEGYRKTLIIFYSTPHRNTAII